MVYANNFIKQNVNRMVSKIVVFDVICRREYYAFWARNGISHFRLKFFSMPTISIWDLLSVKNALYGLRYYKYAVTLAERGKGRRSSGLGGNP